MKFETGRSDSGPGNRAERRAMKAREKEHASRLAAMHDAAQRPGAGYEVDRFIRSCILTYNGRLIDGGWRSLPTSFDFMRSFLSSSTYMPGIQVLSPKIERDHLFSFPDFVDWLTSDAACSPENATGSIPEGVVLNYTVMAPLADVVVGEIDGSAYVVSGFSMVRHAEEVSWFLIGGKELDEEQWARENEISAEEFPAERTARLPGKEHLQIPKSKGEPVRLEGHPSAHRVIMMGVFDLVRMRHVARSIHTEYDKLFTVISSIPDHAGESPDPELVGSFADGIAAADPIWSMAQSLFLLPAYFDFRVPFQQTVAVRDGQALPAPPTRLDPRKDRFRLVTSLRPVQVPVDSKVDATATRTYTPPESQVEVEGFYRRLAPDSVGRDRDGQPIMGQTWVRSHMRWRDRPAKASGTIYVKASVRAAMDRADHP